MVRPQGARRMWGAQSRNSTIGRTFQINPGSQRWSDRGIMGGTKKKGWWLC